MIVLAIDTAGVDCAAAVFDSDSGKLLGRVSETIGRGHAERLMAMIDDALTEAGLSLTDIGRDESLVDLINADGMSLPERGGRRGHVTGTFFHAIAAVLP